MLDDEAKKRWLAEQQAHSERVSRAWAEEGARLAAYRAAKAKSQNPHATRRKSTLARWRGWFRLAKRLVNASRRGAVCV